MSSNESATASACAYHPDREGGVRCQRCNKAICPSCMNQASVGFHCPSCVKAGKQRVVKGRAAFGDVQPVVTIGLIAINALLYFYETSRGVALPSTRTLQVDQGEWWRLITGGFLHGSLMHLGMNMYSLWILGRIFEKSLGTRDYLLTYFGSLLAGSLGVVVEGLVNGEAAARGASGAIFGLMGALVILYRSRGISLAASGLMPILLINAFVSFLPGISLSGHLGGFLGGCAFGAIFYLSKKQLPAAMQRTGVAMALCGLLFVAGVFLA